MVVEAEEELLFSASLDNTLMVWDSTSLHTKGVMRETRSEISCLQVDPTVGVVYTGCDNGSMHVWNPTTGGHSISEGHANTLAAITCARTAKYSCVVSVGFDSIIAIWEVTHLPPLTHPASLLPTTLEC
mmetsp:Transcript_42290/g.91931  ORF Transcript_42290/g.91931 Transcript_42290/m.91931 type:complete len:129 (-) Transcript_42290:1619-2005(-)